MEILFSSVHTIEYELGKVNARTIPDSFDTYIVSLMAHINSNKSVRYFESISEKTRILTNIRSILNYKKCSENQLAFDDIANMLLDTEIQVQKNISKLGKNVKRGSLIQALIKEEDLETFKFLIAKVEQAGFVDDNDLSFKTGFSRDEKNIWKTCVFELWGEKEKISVGEIKVCLDTNAKYWYEQFLELKELRGDDLNTQVAFKSIDTTLHKYLKKNYPKDFFVLRNNVIGRFRRNELLDYNNLIEDVFEKYVPHSIKEEDYYKIVNRIRNLPDIKNFDRQFVSQPKVVNARIKNIYRVNPVIEVKVLDHIDDLDDMIEAEELDDGKRILKIKITEDDTYYTFGKR